uniref:Large ribosomal subunit protein uL6 alpha-beta domain-containing protein n=1 Tax=Chlamydomonas euryale TaxID=1486919 RepID=A0A7R9VA13_9CHLO
MQQSINFKMALAQKAFTPAVASRGPVRVSRVEVYARDSRIGARPITLPKGVTVTLSNNGRAMAVKGPKGELSLKFLDAIKFEEKDGVIKCARVDQTKFGMMQWGLSRTLANNMVEGVSNGFSKTMELVGTGFRASATAKELTLNVGYTFPRVLPIPEGVTVKVEKNTTMTIFSNDKAQLGDFCAVIRKQRPPEPYKGKGIRFQGEVIKLKEGKAGGRK